MPGVAPAGLIDIEDGGVFDRLAQVRVGRCKAAEARWQIASTEPVETAPPNSSPQSSEASRREIRLRTDSSAIAAGRRGPKALAWAPRGQLGPGA